MSVKTSTTTNTTITPSISTSGRDKGGKKTDMSLEYPSSSSLSVRDSEKIEESDDYQALLSMAKQLHNHEKHREALGYFQKALRVATRVCGQNSREVANILKLKGDHFRAQDLVVQALDHYEKSFRIYKDFHQQADDSYEYGSDSDKISELAIAAAVIFSEMEDVRRMTKFFGINIRINEASHGPESKEVADGFFYLAQNQFILRKHDQALQNYKRCLVLRRKVFGSHSEEVAKTLHVYGRCNAELRQYGEALKALEEACAIFQKLHKSDHHDLRKSLCALGVIYRDHKQLEKSAECLQRAVDMGTRMGCRSGEEMGHSYLELGRTLKQLHKSDAALKNLKKAVRTFMFKTESKCDAQVAEAQMLIAEIHAERDEDKETEDAMRQALSSLGNCDFSNFHTGLIKDLVKVRTVKDETMSLKRAYDHLKSVTLAQKSRARPETILDNLFKNLFMFFLVVFFFFFFLLSTPLSQLIPLVLLILLLVFLL